MTREELAMALRKNWPAWLALVFLFCAGAFFGTREFWRWRQIESDYKNAEKEIAVILEKTGELEREYDNMNNPALLEKDARSRLNLKREGESVLVVVSENNFPKEDFLAQLQSGEFDGKSDFWLNLDNWRKYFFQ